MAGPTVVVKFLGDASDVNKAVEEVTGTEHKLSDWAKNVGGAIAGAFAVKKVVDFAKGSIDAAKDLNANMSRTKTIFGEAADSVADWSKTTSKGLGIAQSDSLAAANTIGKTLVGSYNLSSQAAADMSKGVVELAKDMATFNRVPFPEALDALEKGLGGATRGLKGLGVVMSDAEVNAKAVQMGLAQTTVDLGKVDKATTAAKKAQITYNDAVKKHGQNSSEAQKAMLTLESATAAVDTAMESGKTTVDAAGKAQAIYALTLEKTEMQQGAAERAAKSAGGQNERAAAQWKDMQAELGQKLLPIMAQWATIMNEHIVPALASVATFVADNAQYLVPLVAIIGGTVVAMKAWKVATELWKSAQQIATAAQWAFNAAIHANPIGLIILAIAAFIAILVLAYKNVDWFRDAVDAMGRGAVAAFNWVLDAGRAVFNWAKDNWPLLLGILTGPFGLAVALIVKNFDTIRDAFRAAINFVIDGWNSISFKLPEIDTKIPGIGKIGGGSFSAPKIPRLDQGGIITQTGLILAHAGEAITPAPAGVGGPAVNIEKAYFSDAADVNVLLRETEYALTAGRL